jgi:ribosomal protein S12 methylthiotransferase accessory factor YcaO
MTDCRAGQGADAVTQAALDAAIDELAQVKRSRAHLRQQLREAHDRLALLERLAGIEQLAKIADWDGLTRTGVAQALRDDVAENLNQTWYNAAIAFLVELIECVPNVRSAS